jgi:hypothetical protein
MQCPPLRIAAVMVGLTAATAATSAAEKKPDADRESVVYDEAREGDLGPIKPDSKATVRATRPGVYVVKGAGTDAVDDVDAFVFEVTGKTPFDFCLEADAAEFKWLRAVSADGKVTDVAFGSTNLSYRAPRNIHKSDLPPGTYRVVKEAGFRATGSTEEQIEQCRKYGLRAFVFIWPHEAGTIPARHKDDKAVLCYYLSDRIPPAKWGLWATLEDTACQGDPYHPAIFTMRGLWGEIDSFCPHVRARAMEY